MDVPLRLSAASMRDLGHRAVDEVVDHLTTLRDRPVGSPPDREMLEAFMDAALPAEPRDAIEVMKEAVEHIREFVVHTDHPRFLAYIPGPSTYVGAVADFLASGFNVFAGQWLVGSGPAVMERITIDWLRTVCGFPATAGGLFALADLCAENGLWLHVDGAYGAAAALSESAGDLLHGLSRADSLALDPHKWWYQPYEAGCVLVRDETALIDAYSMNAEYLRETRHGTAPLNYYDFGPQLTRGFRALKMWMTFRTFGLDAFRRAVEHGIALAEYAEELILDSGRWEVVSPAQLAIVTFRPRLPGATPAQVDAVTRAIAGKTLEDGFALVLTTEIRDRPVLRLCITHPETTPHDIEETVALLGRLADDASPPQFLR